MADEPWLDAAELEAWITLTVLIDALPAAVDTELKGIAGINFFQYTILAMLSEQDDRTLQMSDLAGVAFGSLSRVSHSVDRLERRGWVERRAGVGGRRHTVVTLTDEGFEAIREAAPAHVRHVRSVLVEPLSPDELAQLASIGRKMIDGFDPALAAQLREMIPVVIERNRAGGTS